MPNAAGISKASDVNIIRNKVAHMDDREKLVTPCMDELSLKIHLFYDIKKTKLLGSKILDKA